MNENSAWFKVIAPNFDNIDIGDIFGTEDNLIGRRISYNASELKELKPRAGYRIIFKVTSVKDSECKAELDSLALSHEQISRLTRHNVSKIDMTVPVKLGEISYMVKLLCAINKAQNRYRKAVIAETRSFIESELKDAKLKDVFIDIITNKLQNKLHKKLNKIYPTRVAEIRMVSPKD
jgi:ribosomal protein S3AE